MGWKQVALLAAGGAAVAAGAATALHVARPWTSSRIRARDITGAYRLVVPELSAGAMGLLRIAYGLLLLRAVTAHIELPSLPFPRDAHRERGALGGVELTHTLASSATAHAIIQVGTIVSIVLFTVGALTRIAIVAAAVGLALHVVIYLTALGAHAYGLPLLVLILLVVVPWGHGFSVDETVRRLRGKTARPATHTSRAYGLALWLPGFALGVALAAAAYAKLHVSGTEWITGGAVQYHWVEDGVNAPVDWGLWIAAHKELAVVMSLGAVALEGLFFLNVFFRGERWRLVFGGALLSLLLGLWLFQNIFWFFWWALLAFFIPWQSVFEKLHQGVGELTVFLDGQCPLCRRTGRAIHGLDWLDKVGFADANDAARVAAEAGASVGEALEQMLVVDASRRVHRGLDAYVRLARALPVTWPLVPLLALPPVRSIGERLYARIAARRTRTHCDAACATDPHAASLPARATCPPRPAMSPVAGGLVALLVVLFIALQIRTSAEAVEHEPFLSNYPMYSWTWESREQFDAARDLKFTSYRFVRADGAEITDEAAKEQLVSITQGLLDPYNDTPTGLKTKMQTLEDPRAVRIIISRRAFDWDAGDYYWKARNVEIGTIRPTTAEWYPAAGFERVRVQRPPDPGHEPYPASGRQQ